MKAIAFLLIGMFVPPVLAFDTRGSVCVAPVPPGRPGTADIPEHICSSGRLSFKVDAQPVTPFPHKTSVNIEDLDLAVKHRVTISCDDRPQQSFSFRFAEYQSQNLCLFINDLYQTVQLWESKRAPWCNCQPARPASH